MTDYETGSQGLGAVLQIVIKSAVLLTIRKLMKLTKLQIFKCGLNQWPHSNIYNINPEYLMKGRKMGDWVILPFNDKRCF